MVKQVEGAIVIGGHFQGLGVVRALGREGIDVFVFDSEPCMAQHSRFCRRYVRTPAVLDEKAYLGFLLDFARTGSVRGWVLFPTDDETVCFLAKNRSALQEYYRLMTPGWEVVKYAYNKRLSYQLAAALDIPIPLTSFPASEQYLDDIDIPFPLIIKPAVMRDFFRKTGKKVFRAVDRESLHRLYREAAAVVPPDELIIQEEIPRVSENLFSFCPFFREGTAVSYVTAQRLRQHPMDFGQASTYAVSLEVPQLRTMGERMLARMGYYGLAEVEFIRDPRTGTFLFLEINPRIWGWHTLAVRAGVNLPLQVYSDLCGRPLPPVPFREGVVWARLLTDLPTVLGEIFKGRMTVREYLRSMRGEKEWAVLAADDPLPFWWELAMLPYLYIRRGF
ncbi:ATP-grasp domain-containing protein [bacterium]|nr:ATP-grasp domain-containing protein [bacterium]